MQPSIGYILTVTGVFNNHLSCTVQKFMVVTVMRYRLCSKCYQSVRSVVSEAAHCLRWSFSSILAETINIYI